MVTLLIGQTFLSSETSRDFHSPLIYQPARNPTELRGSPILQVRNKHKPIHLSWQLRKGDLSTLGKTLIKKVFF